MYVASVNYKIILYVCSVELLGIEGRCRVGVVIISRNNVSYYVGKSQKCPSPSTLRMACFCPPFESVVEFRIFAVL